MFIGHCGAAFGLKSLDQKTPLWVYLIGVQLVDIFFFSFVLTGIEKMNIVPGFTAFNSYDLYCMPYTHGLFANVLWFLGVSILSYWYLSTNRPKSSHNVFYSLLIGASVFSHWITDWIVHTPDLPLWSDDSPKVGLGLWNSVPITIGVELLILLLGLYFYQRQKAKDSSFKNMRLVIFTILLMILTGITPFMPEPHSTIELSVQAIASYLIIAAIGYWTEK